MAIDRKSLQITRTWKKLIVALLLVFGFSGCDYQVAPYPHKWAPDPSRHFWQQCSEVSGDYRFVGDATDAAHIHGGGYWENSAPFLLGFDNTVANRLRYDESLRASHIRISLADPGTYLVNVLDANDQIIEHTSLKRACHWADNRIVVNSKTTIVADRATDNSLTIHEDYWDCLVYPICQHIESWSRWPEFSPAVRQGQKADLDDFVKGGCDVGNPEACTKYFDAHPDGQFRMLASSKTCRRPDGPDCRRVKPVFDSAAQPSGMTQEGDEALASSSDAAFFSAPTIVGVQDGLFIRGVLWLDDDTLLLGGQQGYQPGDAYLWKPGQGQPSLALALGFTGDPEWLSHDRILIRTRDPEYAANKWRFQDVKWRVLSISNGVLQLDAAQSDTSSFEQANPGSEVFISDIPANGERAQPVPEFSVSTAEGALGLNEGAGFRLKWLGKAQQFIYLAPTAKNEASGIEVRLVDDHGVISTMPVRLQDPFETYLYWSDYKQGYVLDDAASAQTPEEHEREKIISAVTQGLPPPGPYRHVYVWHPQSNQVEQINLPASQWTTLLNQVYLTHAGPLLVGFYSQKLADRDPMTGRGVALFSGGHYTPLLGGLVRFASVSPSGCRVFLAMDPGKVLNSNHAVVIDVCKH